MHCVLTLLQGKKFVTLFEKDQLNILYNAASNYILCSTIHLLRKNSLIVFLIFILFCQKSTNHQIFPLIVLLQTLYINDRNWFMLKLLKRTLILVSYLENLKKNLYKKDTSDLFILHVYNRYSNVLTEMRKKSTFQQS